MVIFAWCSVADAAQAAEITIEVATNQIVSLSGRGPSLRAVIEDVCYRAGVDLIAYDADDRPYGGHYEQLPVSLFFERVLSEESFLVETVQAGGIERVSVLRILGHPTVAAARRARGDGPRRKQFQVPPALVGAALSRETDASNDRETALAVIGVRIAGDPVELQRFLSTEPILIAQAIQRHAGAEKALRELQQRYPDPRIREKIDKIVTALKSLGPLQRESQTTTSDMPTN